MEWLRGSTEFQHRAKIEPESPDSLLLTLTTKLLVRVNLQKKTVYDSSYLAACNRFFCVQDCRSCISQVEYQGQARNTRFLERKPLINTCYRIRHRLKLKYSHFARFLLIAHRAAHQPQKKREPVWGMSLRKVTLLGSILASVTDFKKNSNSTQLKNLYNSLVRWQSSSLSPSLSPCLSSGTAAISPKVVPEA